VPRLDLNDPVAVADFVETASCAPGGRHDDGPRGGAPRGHPAVVITGGQSRRIGRPKAFSISGAMLIERDLTS
jgi:hypothetical protein